MSIPHIGLLVVDQILGVLSIDHIKQRNQGPPRQHLYPELPQDSHFQQRLSSSQDKNSHSQQLAQLLKYAIDQSPPKKRKEKGIQKSHKG